MLKSVERIWARATGHLMGSTDQDKPDVPILTLRQEVTTLQSFTVKDGFQLFSDGSELF